MVSFEINFIILFDDLFDDYLIKGVFGGCVNMWDAKPTDREICSGMNIMIINSLIF